MLLDLSIVFGNNRCVGFPVLSTTCLLQISAVLALYFAVGARRASWMLGKVQDVVASGRRLKLDRRRKARHWFVFPARERDFRLAHQFCNELAEGQRVRTGSVGFVLLFVIVACEA